MLSVLLTGEKAADGALRRLEEFRAASRGCGENLLFGLLCDLPESGETLSHADRALLDHAAAKTDALNARCGGGFYLFTRDRLYSRDSGKFAPWERKRGALLELCRLLAGENTTLRVRAGDAEKLRSTRYILTLDADTRLEPESAGELIGAALHLLNRPAVDPKRGIVFRRPRRAASAHRRVARERVPERLHAPLCPHGRRRSLRLGRPGRCIWMPFKAAASRGRGSSMWGHISRVWGNAFPKGAY